MPSGEVEENSLVVSRWWLVAVFVVVFVIIPLGDTPARAEHANSSNWADQSTGVTGLERPVALDWLPDGRALVLGQLGKIYLADTSAGTESLYFTIPNVDGNAELGSLDIEIDRSTSPTRFYVYYAYNPTDRLRIAEYTFTGNPSADLSSQTLIWESDVSYVAPNHIGGSINISPDGQYFFVSIGDNLNASNSDNLSNIFGSILRLDRNGNAPSDNPFFDGNGPNADEIWAYQVRNPWKGSFDEVTGRYLFGDVGGNNAPTAYEEINLGVAGAKYGWPSCEGPLGQPKNGADCPPGTTAPLLYYSHDPGGGCCSNASVTAGEVFRSPQLPEDLHAAYIFGDFSVQDIRWATFDSGGSVDNWGILKQLSNRNPVWIGAGPNGEIHYIDFDYGSSGEVRTLRYTGNLPPVITQASASPTSGSSPLDVTFTGAATDPDNASISYLWDFGDNTSSSDPNPTHQYQTDGIFEARLRVDAGGDTVFSDPITIVVGTPPTVLIDSPIDGSTFSAGDVINMSASASGNGPFTWNWTILFQHDNHAHPEFSSNSQTPVFQVPTSGHDFQGDTSFLVSVTVTDSIGLEGTHSVEIEPNTVLVNLSTAPQGLNLGVDGITQSTEFVLKTIDGFQHELSANTQCVASTTYNFSHWSQGGPATQILTVPSSNASYTAHFNTGASCVEGLQRAIIASSDDAEGSGTALTSSDLDLGEKDVGLRFTDIQIPGNGVITDARIQFTGASVVGSGFGQIDIRTHLSDNSPTFIDGADVSGRSRSASSVGWSPPAWSAGEAGPAQQTPNLSVIVQEIIDRAGWQSGNAISFVFENNQALSRIADSSSTTNILLILNSIWGCL